MGDIVSLVEKAQETIEAEQAERMMKRFKKGQFNMNDLKAQLEQMMKMGGMQGVMGMLPGMKKMSKQIEDAGGVDDKIFKRQIALIQSMTKKERANPQIMQASRKKRVAAGAGLSVQELNQLLKMQRQMGDMMKKMGKGGMLKQAMKGMLGKGGGMPAGMDPNAMDPKAMEEAAKKMGNLPGLGGGGLPGLGGGGGLPLGLSGFGKKK
jgi:signal recognition particle subunit SRP54